MVKTVIFDLGGVIVPFDFGRSYAAMKPFCPHTPEQIRERLTATTLLQDFESGRLTGEEFKYELCAAIDLSVDYEQFCEIWSSIFLPKTLIEESLLSALGERYRLLLLSNTNSIHFAMIRRTYGLLKHFDHFVLSYEVGAMKPEPEIYREAIARAGCAASECFYTDDIQAYVEGARQAGIDAVQFESAEQVQRELRARGVSWNGVKEP